MVELLRYYSIIRTKTILHAEREGLKNIRNCTIGLFIMEDVKPVGELVKPVGERVKEGVALIRKMLEIGIVETEPGYTAMKARVDAWIKKDEAWTGKIDFVRYGRRAYVNLPMRVGSEATAVLKVWKY